MPRFLPTTKNVLSASLSAELIQEQKVRSLGVRNGDTVAVLRGNFKDVEGKVSRVNRRTGYVYVEGVTREKADGSARQIPVHSSKIVIRRLVLDDKRRKEILQRRASITSAPKLEEKPKSKRGAKGASPRQRKKVEKKEA